MNARPALEIGELAALAHIGFVDQAFGDDDMRHGVDHRDVGAGHQRQVIVRLDVRRPHEVDAARIDDDEPRALRAAASSCARRRPGARRSGWRR